VYDGLIHALKEAMPTEKPVKKTFSGLALRFAGGAGMGALMTSVPFSAGYASQLSIFQISLAGLVVVTSGVMSCLWGDKFLDTVSKALDSTSV
jgi:hypothetical protein